MTLFDECLEALGEDVCLLSNSEKERVFGDFRSMFPFTEWGRIKWEKVSDYDEVTTIEEISTYLNRKFDGHRGTIYVIWDERTLPIIKSDLNKVFAVIDDVTAVSFDTWIYSPTLGYVIELFHDGKIRIGLKD